VTSTTCVTTLNPQNPTKILIHGYDGKSDNRLMIQGRNAYLAGVNYVIRVDWGVLAAAFLSLLRIHVWLEGT
jgi:hypothetical protein